MGKRYYDNYDYEEAYKEQCKKLEEAEMERWMKEGWVNCLYRTSTYKSTNTESNTTLLESMVYPSFKFKADMPKTEKKRETSPSQSNLNDKNARRYLIRLANINFGKGDIWATFGWNNGLLPETYEDAKKDVVNFIRRINRKRKKLGLENAKYIYIIAFEEYTRPHFHLLISGGIDRDELERMWGNESIKEAAKEAAKTLKNGGPYKNRTGAYAKDWTAGQREKKKSVVQIQGYTVYNKDHFQLTHLLEYGHQSRNGGRAKAFSHIAPLNDQIGEIVASKIESKLRG